MTADAKLRACARNGVPEYWIVNLPESQLEVDRDPQGEAFGSCVVFSAGQTVATLARPDAPIAVADLLP
jgi:Uma2 family endonuclease